MPSTLYALYLSRAARGNLDIGLAEGRWGLTEEAVTRQLSQLEPSRTGLEVLRELEVGDQVLAASGGPQPRVKRGGWAGETLQEGFLWRVTSPYFYDTSRLWPAPPNRPDESYPHRFGIEGVEQLTGITAERIAIAGMDAMHYSANIGGLPVPVLEGAPLLSTLDALRAGESEDPGFLVLGGELDATVLTSVRREQRKLRAKLFGNATTGDCSLCGNTVPVDCLRTAHIKQRCECSEHERRDEANIMPACTLGCDHLFELGYIYVDTAGSIRATDRATTNATTAVAHAVGRLAGRTCKAYSTSSAQYFAWHRAKAAQ
ncbi:MAG: hypothetical protein ABR992_00070 [Solirubrobacteraceae bacterium]|jgi:hypothetical protein